MNYSKQNLRKKRQKIRPKKTQIMNSVLLAGFKLLLLMFVIGCVCAAGLVFGSVQGIFASTPTSYSLEPKYSATVIYDSSDNVVQYLSNYDSNRIIIKSDQMPENLKNAFISIEDERFYDHNGIDLKGIARALYNNIIHRGISEGASTITQQLIKNNVFDVGGEQNVLARIKRKIEEQYMAIRAEKKFTKEQIITDYLNTINLGKGTLGVEAAAKYYFGKSASDLTLSECAVIAGITKNPSYLNPVDYPEENANRRLTILKKMLDLKKISSEEYQEAVADEDVYSRITEHVKDSQKTSIYSYFTDALILQTVDDLQKRCGYTQTQAYNLVYRGGLRIFSTQDTQLQKIADKVINDKDNYPVDTKYSLEYTLEVKHENGETDTYTTANLKKYYRKKDKNYKTIYSSKKKMESAVSKYKKAVVKDTDTIINETIHYSLEPQISYTLMDQTTGQVKVIVGGRGQKQDDLALNRATSVTRQPGSTFKILSTYAPAIDSNEITLGTVFNDAPYTYESGVNVHNFERKYFGLTTVRDAIKESDNVVAVKALTKLTPKVGFNYLLKLGFTTLVQNRTSNGKNESDINQALALGGITDGVTNLQLTAAYASIANKGEYNSPILYTKITDSEGNVLLENKQETTRVMKESTAWLLTSAMEDVVKSGTGKEAKLASKMAVAGKTGTSSNNYDYWFCGYTPYYTASIWTGYDYNTDFASGADYHKEIWAKIMDKAIEKKQQKIKKNFDSCNSIVKAKICVKSGKRPVDNLCSKDPEHSMVKEEYFAKDTVPKDTCDEHILLTLCKDSKKLSSKYCPKESLQKKVYRKRPSDTTGTTDDSPYFVPFDINNKKNLCNIHTKEWFDAEEEKKKAAEAATATNPDGSLVNPPTGPAASTVAPGATKPAATTQKKKQTTKSSTKKKN